MRFLRLFYKLRLRTRTILRRYRVERELDDELRYHLERQIEANIAKGLTPTEARRAALGGMGGLDQRKEECRDRQGLNFIDGVVQDVRYAGRILRRSPSFTIMALATLAIGIGGIATIFTVVNGVILRPLPYEDADRLVLIGGDFFLRPAVPPPEGTDWPYRNQLFDGLTWIAPGMFTMPDSDSPLVNIARVPPDYFSVVRARPVWGRDFFEREASDSPSVAILSHSFWQQRLAGNPNIIGETLQFSEATLTVVGIMPPRFRSPFYEDVQVWTVVEKEPFRGEKLGRMKPGLTPAEVQTGINNIIRQVAEEFPQSAGKREAEVFHILPNDAANQRLLLILFGSVGFILFIAIINVANLMFSRGVTREREIAIRSAIGGGRRRIIRQLLTESLVLSLTGGAIGLLIGQFGVLAIVRLIPRDFPRIHEIHMDPVVAGFVLVVTIVASLAFGTLPALVSSRNDLQHALKDGSRHATENTRRGMIRQALITVEVGLAAILLVGAALTGKSFWKLITTPLGFDTENVLVANLRLPPGRHRSPVERAALQADLSQRLKGYREVESVSFTNIAPLPTGFPAPSLAFEGSSQTIDHVIRTEVTDDYFHALKIPVRQGRTIKAGEQTAVINETMARGYWPGSDPIGSRIKFGPADSASPWLTIVGVVPDIKMFPVSKMMPQVFSSCLQCNVLLLKVRAMPPGMMRSMRSEIAEIDKSIVVTSIETLDAMFAAQTSVVNSRFRMALFVTFAGAGLLLAFAGVYGVTSYAAAQKTQEAGIRMALGATPSDVFRLMLRHSMTALAIGIALGLIGASALSRLLRSYLFEVEPLDPAVFLMAPILLGLVAIAANLIPARRISRIDPLAALKYE